MALNIKKIIQEIAKKERMFAVPDILLKMDKKISRQYISRVIHGMVQDGVLVKIGSTKNAKYTLAVNGTVTGNKDIIIELYTYKTLYIARSQAKRILHGLEKFKTVTMDFKNVPTVGQAFADEVFRVFHIRHPEVNIVPIHMVPPVEYMIKRAKNQRKNEPNE